ncbi:conserved hypothetical protein [Verticillium alfalfae VaMs.102]|uniref:Uncharacterized protein n=1 Tax=Verticillium alfalfae (strain VaMs.102 / ATCC MYA-4576 / FGSC 10136) TaxID=526221 RepID=C9SQF9_VERA1|nr:conserved hypothetical protein [Verticillium alfalfae VaMs.102]EEY21084.1 conserved hypothetical protein [Verticillium alfalfae VaMs.102]
MDHAPFCAPEKDGELFVGKTYYVTWDATAPVLKSNTSEKVWIHLVGYYINSTTGEIDETEDPIFNPNKKHVKPAKHGFYPWHVGGNTIPRGEQNATIQLRIQRHIDDEYVGPDVVGQTVFVRRQDRPPHRDSRPPGDKELYIALPIVGAGLLFILGGLFWYNRRSRRVRPRQRVESLGFEKAQVAGPPSCCQDARRQRPRRLGLAVAARTGERMPLTARTWSSWVATTGTRAPTRMAAGTRSASREDRGRASWMIGSRGRGRELQVRLECKSHLFRLIFLVSSARPVS